MLTRDKADTSAEYTAAARTVLLTAAVLGVLADTFARRDGVGWTIWVASLSLAAVYVARRRAHRVTTEQWAWLAGAVACAGAFAWRDADQLRALNVLGTLVSVSLFAMCAAGLPAASILVARLRDVVTAGVFALRDVTVGAPMLAARDADLASIPVVRGGAKWTALRAILITAPFALVFVVLLSRADPAFERVFELPDIDAERLFEHVVLAGAFAWWSAGWLRGAVLGVARRAALPEQLPLRLGLVEVTAALGAVIGLFAFFVALQLRWLFGGADVVQATTGLTVAEYARRGFFELVGVTALVLPLVLGTRAAIQDENVVRRHRRLSIVLITLLGAIVASALLRMRLYVSYFGLTTDRLYATAVMVWLSIVFAAMVVTVLRGWPRPFAAMTVLSGFAMLFTLNAVNPELLVARVNISRSSSVREVDYQYLARLSGDAAPTVVQALKAAVAAAETCKAATALRERWLRQDTASWNLAARRARQTVLRELTEPDVQRLCVGVPVTR